MELVGTQYDEISRLFDFSPLCINIGDASGTLAVRIEVDFEYIGVRSQFKVRPLQQDRKYRRLGRSLRVVVAPEAFAVAAECTGPKLRAVRIGVSAGRIGGRLWKRVVAHLLGGLREQSRSVYIRHCGQWIGVAARAFERIA